MPFTRPVAGMPVTVEDFGQPVYDATVRQGFSQMGSGNNTITATVPKLLPLPTALQTATGAFTPNGDKSVWTCALAGVYQCFGIIAAGGTAFPAGTYVAITKTGNVMNRMVSSYANAGNGYVYETLSVSYTGVLNIGDQMSLQVYTVGGNITMGSGGPTVNDPVVPSLHIWRIGI